MDGRGCIDAQADARLWAVRPPPRAQPIDVARAFGQVKVDGVVVEMAAAGGAARAAIHDRIAPARTRERGIDQSSLAQARDHTQRGAMFACIAVGGVANSSCRQIRQRRDVLSSAFMGMTSANP